MRVESLDPIDPDLERVAVVPDSTEDLWHLQYVIEPGDLVEAAIDRRIQREEDTLRDTGGQRETMRATIEVDSVEFHDFADRLRVGGSIVGCSREDQIGRHHTINVGVHDRLELEKRFKPDQRDRLEEAEAATDEPDVLVVTIEEGQAEVFDVSQRGPQHRVTVTSGSGKRGGQSTRDDLFAEVADIITRSDTGTIVLAGPGFAKDDLAAYLADAHHELAESLRVVDTAAIGERGVQEVLRRGVIDDLREESRTAQEADLIEELLTNLKTDPDRVTYGPEHTAKAAEYGAVETLCIVDDRLRRERGGDGEWSVDVDVVIDTVEQQGGEVRIFAGGAEPGRQLENLGGIAAILRYQLADL